MHFTASFLLSAAVVGTASAVEFKKPGPKVGAKFQMILDGQWSSKQPTDVDVWDLDPFSDPKGVAAVKDKSYMICYFSAGTVENGRSDAKNFQSSDIGPPLKDWPDESYVNTNSPAIRKIMADRIATMSAAGCDAIDPDNVDSWDNENGLGLTKQDAIDYVTFLSDTAASYGMATGLKNAIDILDDVKSKIAFAVNEQCGAMNECGKYSNFTAIDGKPVFNVEYNGCIAKGMPAYNSMKGFSSLAKDDLCGTVYTPCALDSLPGQYSGYGDYQNGAASPPPAAPQSPAAPSTFVTATAKPTGAPAPAPVPTQASPTEGGEDAPAPTPAPTAGGSGSGGYGDEGDDDSTTRRATKSRTRRYTRTRRSRNSPTATPVKAAGLEKKVVKPTPAATPAATGADASNDDAGDNADAAPVSGNDDSGDEADDSDDGDDAGSDDSDAGSDDSGSDEDEDKDCDKDDN